LSKNTEAQLGGRYDIAARYLLQRSGVRIVPSIVERALRH